jgi:hypothetical protein
MVEAFAKLPTRSAVLDGELTLIGADGQAKFYRLMDEMRTRRPDESALVYFCFDLLHQDGVDVRGGRTLLHELFATAGDIHVKDGELNLTLAPLSSPLRTHAAQALCEILDKTATIFPGSRLRIRLEMRPTRRIGLALPSSPAERHPSADPVPAP